MYPDGGRELARTGMRNKLFSLHGLTLKIYKSMQDCQCWQVLISKSEFACKSAQVLNFTFLQSAEFEQIFLTELISNI